MSEKAARAIVIVISVVIHWAVWQSS